MILSNRRVFMLTNCFLLFLGVMKVSGQNRSNDSLVYRSIVAALSHGQSIKNVKFRVQLVEKNRFSKFVGIAKQRLNRIEGIKEGQWYGNATVSDVYFGNFSQMIHEIKVSKGLRKSNNTPLLFFWPDLYQDIVGTQCVSPLNFHALDYYQFDFLSDTLVDNQACKKFKVSPKSKLNQLFKGYLVLSTDGWVVRWQGAIISDDIQYNMDLIHSYFDHKWIPKESYIDVQGGILGAKGEFQLHQIVIGQPTFWEIPTNVFKKPALKTEILNIAERAFDDVSVSQLVKNLHDGIKRKWRQRQESDLLDVDSVYMNLDDSVTLKPVGILDDLTDSNVETSTSYFDPLVTSPFRLSQILFSKSFYFGLRRAQFYPFELYYKSPVFDSNFNTAEGFVVNAAIVLRKRWAQYHLLEAEFLGRRSFGLNRNTGFVRVRYKTENFEIQAQQGDYVAQFNADNTISPEMNSLSTLLLKNNQMKIYRKEFWNLSFFQRFSSRFYLKGLVESSRQSQMDNTTNYHWINYLDRKFSSNNPTNSEYKMEGFESHFSTISQFQLGFRPFLNQAFRNEVRTSDWASSPLMVLKYRAGWPSIFKSDIRFQLFELSYVQNLTISPWIKMGFLFNAGTFIGDKPQYFQDFKHFNGGISLVQTGETLASHRLVGYYQNLANGAGQRLNVNHYLYSTAGNYIEALSLFQFSNLWLKPILGIKNAYVKEILIANAYYINNQNLFYNELGYGLDGFLKLFRLEAIANFTNGQFNYLGFRVNINTRIRVGNIPE